MARRKIASGVGGVEGAQSVPGIEHGPKKVFQDETAAAYIPRSFRTILSRFFPTQSIPGSPLDSQPRNFTFYFRRLIFGLVCVAVYGLVDRTTVYLQIWPSISAWYPPVGLMVALLVGIGPSIIPVIVVAGYLAGYVNYHQDVRGLPFLLINPLIPVVYGIASIYLRRKLTGKYRVRSVSDVTTILGVSLLASLASATCGTALSRFQASRPFCWNSSSPGAAATSDSPAHKSQRPPPVTGPGAARKFWIIPASWRH